MKDILIDNREKLSVVIVLYGFSILVWARFYLEQLALAIFLIIDGPPRTPIEASFLTWWWIYPIAVVFCLLIGGAFYHASTKKVATITFAIPFGIAVLLAFPVLFTYVQVKKEEQTLINSLVNINDLNLSDTDYDQEVLRPAFEDLFLMPPGSSEKNIIQWNGEVLIFQTSMSPKEVHTLYVDTYNIMGLESVSAGGRSVTYRLNGVGALEFMYSESENQFFTVVGIFSCDDVRQCWAYGDRFFENYP